MHAAQSDKKKNRPAISNVNRTPQETMDISLRENTPSFPLNWSKMILMKNFQEKKCHVFFSAIDTDLLPAYFFLKPEIDDKIVGEDLALMGRVLYDRKP